MRTSRYAPSPGAAAEPALDGRYVQPSPDGSPRTSERTSPTSSGTASATASRASSRVNRSWTKQAPSGSRSRSWATPPCSRTATAAPGTVAAGTE